MLRDTVRAVRIRLALAVPLGVFVLLTGCGGTPDPVPTDGGSGGADLQEETHGDPDMPRPPDDHGPVLLESHTRPKYSVTNVPKSPDVTGNLKVPLKREWNYIVVHHSFTRAGSEASFDRYHRNVRGWLGVGYHFVIGNGHGSPDGKVEVTFRWEKQLHGAHAGVDKYNQHGIGICLVGNFEKGYPSQKQMGSLAALVNYLQSRCHIPTKNILLHRHVKSTKCPGENFPFYQFISMLEH